MATRTIRRISKAGPGSAKARPRRASRQAHPLVDQLRFTRSEWLRGLKGVTEEGAARHFGPMNSIGWIVGHLTWQEQRYLLDRPQGIMLREDIQKEFFSGAPMTTPSFAEMLKAQRAITRASDPFLDQLAAEKLLVDLPFNVKRSGQSQGSAIRRMTYHYWFHIGEIQAIRQQIDNAGLPQYVGNIEGKAPYRPE